MPSGCALKSRERKKGDDRNKKVAKQKVQWENNSCARAL